MAIISYCLFVIHLFIFYSKGFKLTCPPMHACLHVLNQLTNSAGPMFCGGKILVFPPWIVRLDFNCHFRWMTSCPQVQHFSGSQLRYTAIFLWFSCVLNNGNSDGDWPLFWMRENKKWKFMEVNSYYILRDAKH